MIGSWVHRVGVHQVTPRRAPDAPAQGALLAYRLALLLRSTTVRRVLHIDNDPVLWARARVARARVARARVRVTARVRVSGEGEW